MADLCGDPASSVPAPSFCRKLVWVLLVTADHVEITTLVSWPHAKPIIYTLIPRYRKRSQIRSMAEEVKVLGSWSSPFVMRPRIALNLKGVEYEFILETLSNKSELLLKSSPISKKVPVLIHNGKAVSESLVIVQYVDDAWAATGPAILPAEPYARATARFWATYIDDKWFPALRATRMAPTEIARAEAADLVASGLQLLEEAFEKSNEGKGFFGGATIGYLDIALGSYLGWLRISKQLTGIEFLDEGKIPLLTAWAERFSSDAAVKEVMPDTDKLAEFVKARFKAPAQ